MTEPWTPQHVVDPALAKTLIELQFPDLAPVRLESLGEGWDNTAYLVNETFVFRFPRREVAVASIETEARVLPELASRLPLAVPSPECGGVPEPRYPWPFLGYPHLPGRTADRAELDDPARAALARPLGGFLAALHGIPREETASWGLPLDTIGRLDGARMAARIRASLDALGRDEIVGGPDRWVAIASEAAALRAGSDLRVVHGDLYARHLILNDGALTGVIDWGDVHLGDPAVDLSVGWSFLPPSGRIPFRDAYGPIDEGIWKLARLRALHYGVILIDYGRGVNDPHLVREGRTILRLVVSE
jgi:aminoglycoside phosphotransferase (APT) family kinase protein